jgi:hypothetical protein
MISSADAIVFRVLGNLNQGESGVSLEELLIRIGLAKRNLPQQHTKKFRDHYTAMGAQERIQGRGLRSRR